jgi:hypothetical protein
MTSTAPEMNTGFEMNISKKAAVSVMTSAIISARTALSAAQTISLLGEKFARVLSSKITRAISRTAWCPSLPS